MSVRKAGICEQFSQIKWHDSKIIELHLVKESKERYDLLLDLNLITGYSEGRCEWARKTGRFANCRIIRSDLDLLGMLLCGGAIGEASCYPDAVEFERKNRNQAHEFDLPDEANLLEDCLGFQFYLIPPGGEFIVIARDFQLI